MTNNAPLGKVIYASSRHSIWELATDQIISRYLGSFATNFYRSRDLGHTPLGKIIGAPARLFQEEAVYQIWRPSWSNFEDMFDCMPKRLGVTWPRPRPFWEKLFEHPLVFFQMKQYTKFEVSSSSSFEDMFNRIPKILGLTWPRPRPFWGKLL